MSGSVTLNGATGGVVTVQSGSGYHEFIAQIIANTILMAKSAGTLNTPAEVTINGGVATATPPTVAGGENILYLVGTGGGSYTIPAGYNYVVDLLTGPETITGANVQVLAYDSTNSANDSFILSGHSSLAADPNGNYNTTITGAFNEGTGNGNNTITAIGTGTIGGGTGTSRYELVPTVSSGILLQSTGLDDTVEVVSGTSATVLSSGSGLSLTQNGIVTVDATLSGPGGDVQGGAGTMNVDLIGPGGQVLGGSGTLAVTAAGGAETIAAFGASAASVDATGSDALIFGGLNTLVATLSGAGGDTLVGADGGSTVTSSGTADLILGYTGAMTINDSGTSDTIGSFNAASVTATLSGTSDLLFGGSNSLAVTVTGTDDTVAAGSGSSTIDANTGAAIFGGSGPLYFVGGAGTSTILGATGGTEAVTVGSGGAVFFTGSDNSSTIVGGLGQTTLVGGSGSSIMFSSLSGGVGFQYLAGSGNESLDAAGSTTNNIISFFAANGTLNDTVTGWSSDDSLFLQGYNSATSSMNTSGSSVVFDLSNGSTVTFTDATTGEFNGKVLYT